MGIQKPTRAVRSVIIKTEATKYDASRFLPTRAVGGVVALKKSSPKYDASSFFPPRAVLGGY